KNAARFEIDTVESVSKVKEKCNIKDKFQQIPPQRYSMDDYGASYWQIALHNGQLLHAEGFKGEGMLIAVIDGGFTNANTMLSLEYLRNSNRIVATRDFAYGTGDVYDNHYHGSMVLSLMASYLPGEYIGSAPEASYILITSENSYYEEIVEELNWVSAAEYADSMGVDVINTSLGYVDFESPRYNHSLEDMDGNTCPSTIGADIAASRGMLLLIAAGNSGNDESGHVWIGAPSDAKNVIAVGAIDHFQNTAPFTSHGIVNENQVKPDITSVGWGVFADYINDSIGQGSGTSFATPLMTGLATCFWQKFRSSSSDEIRRTMIQAARPTNPISDSDPTIGLPTPNIYTGNGIVDFQVASGIISGITEQEPKPSISIDVFPNPAISSITINTNTTQPAEINIFTEKGVLVDYRKNIEGETSFNIENY
ncbi:MAG: S8 family serine peptidase, partial [Bacteroidales bacterium]|nr:S8 family serine peptidase [Bacteroidales bacterium]